MARSPDFRHYLREWRLKRGMTQADLATAIGTSKGMISRYETSQRGLTIEVQFRLCHALRITPAQFFTDPNALPVNERAGDSPEQLRAVLAAIRALLAKD